MAADVPVKVEIEGVDAGGLEVIQATRRALEQANESTQRMARDSSKSQQQAAAVSNQAVSQMTAAVGRYVSIAYVASQAWKGMQDAMAEETQFARTHAMLDSLGIGTRELKEEVDAYAASMMDKYGIDEAKTLPSLRRILVATHDIAAAEYLVQLSAKASIALGGDQTSWADAMTRALAGKTRGLTQMLAAEGVAITKGSDLNEVFKTLDRTVSHSNEVMDTSGERSRYLNAQLDNLKETLGSVLIPVLGIASGAVLGLAETIKFDGIIIGAFVDLVKDVWPHLVDVMNPANWFRPGAVKAALAELKNDFGYAFDGIAIEYEAFRERLGNLSLKMYGGAGTKAQDVAMPAGLGVGLGANVEDENKPEEDKLKEAAKFAEDRLDIERELNNRLSELRLSEWDFQRLEKQAEYSELLSMFEAGSSQWLAAYEAYTLEMDKIDRDEAEAKRKRMDEEASHRMTTKQKMLATFRKEHAATASFIQSTMTGSINTLTSVWAQHFENQAKGVEETESVWAQSGKAILAMVLQEVEARLAAKATEFAILAAAYAVALDWPHAAGYAAGALLLGGLAVGAGLGAAALTREPATATPAIPETGGGGGGGGGGGSGGSSRYVGSEPRGGNTITNSTVNLYYNPSITVAGNVYGIDDFQRLMGDFLREYAYIRGVDLKGGGG